jgi:hypothetical protein
MGRSASTNSTTSPLAGRRLGWGLAGILVLTAMVVPMFTSAANPPGNNGTVKIDRLPFDTHPDNQPHVGCRFQVDWYGFDKGNLFSNVTFEVHPPTGKPAVLLTDRVFIGEDDNSGGGSVAGLDAQREYNLANALRGYTPHPNQGFHVKLTIRTDGSQGANTKHKVFWVQGCAPVET